MMVLLVVGQHSHGCIVTIKCVLLSAGFYIWISFPGLTAKIIHHTRTMDDVYGAFFDFSCMLKAKVLSFTILLHLFPSFFFFPGKEKSASS